MKGQLDRPGKPGARSTDVVRVRAINFRRDWRTLALLSLATAMLVAVSLEGLARLTFQQTGKNPCLTDFDSPRGVSGVPNCVCRLKDVPESPWIVYRFNSCGYRSDFPCGPKPEGTYRIAAFGSSFTAGYLVESEQTYPALLRNELSSATGRPIDVQNMGMQARVLNNLDQHFGEVLALKPDLIVWLVTAWDIEHADWKTIRDVPKLTWLGEMEVRMRTLVMVRHFLLESPTQAVNAYLASGDHPFLLKSTPEAWQRKLDQFEAYVANITDQAKNNDVPVVIGVIPMREHAIMLSPNFASFLPKDIDPWKMGQDVKAIAERHGAIYVDLLPDFAAVPHIEKLFYPLDTHPMAAGHAIVSHSLTRMLTDGRIAGLQKSSGVAATEAGGK